MEEITLRAAVSRSVQVPVAKGFQVRVENALRKIRYIFIAVYTSSVEFSLILS